jgi:uncharacterized protein (DUF433 family)
MSQVVSMRFQENQMERLQRLARRLGRTPSETSALLVEESLRQAEFGHIDFRDSPVGRQAYIQGSTLAVWEVVSVARGYGMDAQETARHLHWPTYRVQAALNYAAAFAEEIEQAIADNAAYDFEAISRLLPQATRFIVSEDLVSAEPVSEETEGEETGGTGGEEALKESSETH